MADDKETPTERGIGSAIHALFSFIPAELRDMVGFFSGMVLMFAVPAALILGVMILYYAKEKAKTGEVPCWQLQVINERVYKLNSCTGEVSEVKEAVAAPSAKKRK